MGLEPALPYAPWHYLTLMVDAVSPIAACMGALDPKACKSGPVRDMGAPIDSRYE